MKAEQRRWEGIQEAREGLLGDEEREVCGGVWGAMVLPAGQGGGILAVLAHPLSGRLRS